MRRRNKVLSKSKDKGLAERGLQHKIFLADC
jgi:hypothetical protein